MPAIPKSLERLFKQAGRAEEARIRCERREAEKEARQRARERRRQQRARTQAPAAGRAVWEWLKGPQAAALRAGIRAARANSLMILGWIDEEGQLYDDAYYHRWQVLLVPRPGTLRVHRIGSQAGGGVSKEVASPRAIMECAPAVVVVALERAVTSGELLRTVRRALREQMGSDFRPGVVRIQ
jgi:hypothetical protein